MIKHRGKSRLNHSGLPLGGIGAGKVEFCPNGKFTNLTTNNNAALPICAEGPAEDYVVTPQGIPGAFLACFVEGFGARVLKTHSFPGYATLKAREIKYKGLFPRALVGYPEMGEVRVRLEAFSPILLDDVSEGYRDSSIPGAVFIFRLANLSGKTKRASVAMSWRNLVGVGGYPGAKIEDLRGNFISFEDGGLLFGSTRRKADPRVEGEYFLVAGAGEITYMAGWSPGREDFWRVFSEEGRLDNSSGRGNLGAVCSTVYLGPEEEVEVPMVLSWYFPNLLGDTDLKPNYGHAYNRWFSCAREVAVYLLGKYRKLLERTRAWQEEILRSSLPRWLGVKLINDIFPLASNSFYTEDLRFSVYEAHEMRGCLGTIDQRAASNSIYTMCFPRLSRSELSLFAKQQVGKGVLCDHWNFRTGRKDLRLDCEGAIRHEVGWDHLEGGTGPSQWPDIPPLFVLQCYEYVAWTGDLEFLDFVYPKVKKALEYEARLDQDGDGIAEVYGPGSMTYDNRDYPFYGASPYVASLQLAALRAGAKMARFEGDEGFESWCGQQESIIRRSLEDKLWSEELGHFYMWYDEMAENWRGSEREHDRFSDACFVSQLAGMWFADLLDLGYIVDEEKVRRTLRSIALKNGSVGGCPANIVERDGRMTSSWPYYAEVYYAAQAIYEGEVDTGLECLRKVYRAMHELDRSPWDAPLGWDYHLYPGNLPEDLPKGSPLRRLLDLKEGENRWATWGRWYMTNPASWFALPAIAGFSMDLLEGKLVMAPNLPSSMKKARSLPIFMPGFWGRVSCEQEEGLRVCLVITRFFREPLNFKKFVTKVPHGWKPGKVWVGFVVNGKEVFSERVVPDGRRVELNLPFSISGVGESLECRLKW